MGLRFHQFPGEIWKDRPELGMFGQRYAVSNKGNVVSYKGNDMRNGFLLSGGRIRGGNRVIRLPDMDAEFGYKRNGKTVLVARLVAEAFCERPSEEHSFVIHRDHDSGNDIWTNLKWVTKEELLKHYEKSPNVIRQREDYKKRQEGKKLTVTKVIRLKKLLADPNRKTRLKLLAKQFGISEMQLYRIKRGENWGHIQVA